MLNVFKMEISLVDENDNKIDLYLAEGEDKVDRIVMDAYGCDELSGNMKRLGEFVDAVNKAIAILNREEER